MDGICSSIIDFLYDDHRILALLLGGSRSKGIEHPDSDYDFFVLVKSDFFDEIRSVFSRKLEEQKLIQYAAEYSYVENWGYVFKAIGNDGVNLTFFDFSILPVNRIKEMGIRKSNVILFDKTGFLDKFISQNNNSYDTNVLEPKRKRDYVILFGFEYLRFFKSIRENDYWLAYKSLDRMKIYIMRYNRIKRSVFSNTQQCPEKKYSLDFADSSLRNRYTIDGTIVGIERVCESLVNLFGNLIDEKEVLDAFLHYGQLYIGKK